MGATNWSKAERLPMVLRMGMAYKLMDRIGYEPIRVWLCGEGIETDELPSDKALKSYGESSEFHELRQQRLWSMDEFAGDPAGAPRVTEGTELEPAPETERELIERGYQGLWRRMCTADRLQREWNSVADQADQRERALANAVEHALMREMDGEGPFAASAAGEGSDGGGSGGSAKADGAPLRAVTRAWWPDADGVARPLADGAEGGVDGDGKTQREPDPAEAQRKALLAKGYSKAAIATIQRSVLLSLAVALPDMNPRRLQLAIHWIGRRDAMQRDRRVLGPLAYLRCLDRAMKLQARLRQLPPSRPGGGGGGYGVGVGMGAAADTGASAAMSTGQGSVHVGPAAGVAMGAPAGATQWAMASAGAVSAAVSEGESERGTTDSAGFSADSAGARTLAASGAAQAPVAPSVTAPVAAPAPAAITAAAPVAAPGPRERSLSEILAGLPTDLQQRARASIAANLAAQATQGTILGTGTTPTPADRVLAAADLALALALDPEEDDDDDDDDDAWGGMWDDEDPVEFSEDMQSLKWLQDTGFVSAAEGAVMRQEILARAAATATGKGKAM